VVPSLLNDMARWLGFKYAPDLVFFVATGFLFAVVMHFSWEFSRLETRVRSWPRSSPSRGPDATAPVPRGVAGKVPRMLARLSAESRRFYAWLGAAWASGLTVRLFYTLHYKWDQTIYGDAAYYFYQARAISEGHWFVDALRWHWLHQGFHPGAEHPPLNTLFLIIPDLLGFGTFREAMIASVLIGSLTVVVVGFLGREVLGWKLGVVAAFLAAIYANLWINDALVLSETLAALAIALFTLFAYKFWKHPTWRNAAWFGFFGALAILTRAEIVFLIPCLGLALALTARTLSRRQRLERLGVMALLVALPVMPWVTYNMVRFDHPVTLDSGGEFTLANTNCAGTYYGPNLGWWDFNCLANRYQQKGDESSVALHYEHQGLNYAKAHLSRLPVVLLARVGRMWGLFRPIQMLPKEDFEQGRGPRSITKLALIQYYALAILAIIGLVMLRRRRVIIYPLVSLAIIATVAALLAFGATAYRVPAEIAIVVAAAVPLTAFLEHAAEKLRPPQLTSGPPEPGPDRPGPTEATDDTEPGGETVGASSGR
jgi:4-amino-4-deoxy-L-arabinose transferase-like glycosyltransferase